VVCDGNRLAWTSARLAADQPGRHSPLFLCGPTGVGKTHLLEGIWSAYKRAAHGRPALYLTAEQFTCLFLEALRQSGLPSFRRKVRDVGLLLIDDVQFFAGKRATLSELLHTVDTLTREGQQLVLAADRPPSALKALGPELLSRLSGSVQCQLTPPDYAARLEIVARLTVAWELSLPDDVQALVASHFAAHVRQLQGALRRLQAARLAHQRPITLETAEDCLSELLLEQQRAVQLADIERVVVETFGLEPQSLQSDAKHKYVSHPRMLAMWLARKHTRAALSEIGRYFGKRSHTTVISARRKIESLMTQGAQIDLADRRWKVEDAIRRVEDRLRAS
jgi:chromosomal replication initiator protein